jgi:hypothetical protein
VEHTNNDRASLLAVHAGSPLLVQERRPGSVHAPGRLHLDGSAAPAHRGGGLPAPPPAPRGLQRGGCGARGRELPPRRQPPPRRLDAQRGGGQHPPARALQLRQLPRAQKHARAPQLPPLEPRAVQHAFGHLHHLRVAGGVPVHQVRPQQRQAEVGGAAGAQEHGVALDKRQEGLAGGEAGARDAHRLQDAARAQLLQHIPGVERAGDAGGVGLDAADEVRLALGQGAHQPAQLAPEPRAHGGQHEGAAALPTLRVLPRRPLAARRRPLAARLELGREELHQQRHAALANQRRVLRHHKVAVLVQQRVRGVAHLARVVVHHEGVLLAARRPEARVARQLGAQRVRQVLVRGARQAAGLVDEREHARAVGGAAGAGRLGALEQLEHVLVVHKVDVAPGDALRRVLGLLALEHVRVEGLLQLLVGQVDAELLERVGVEALEAVDVEDADGAGGAAAAAAAQGPDLAVDGGHQPVEEAGVEGLGQRVSRLGGLHPAQALDDALPAGLDGTRGERRLQRGGRHAQQRGGRLQRGGAALGRQHRLVAGAGGEGDVAQVQHARHAAQYRVHGLGEQADDVHRLEGVPAGGQQSGTGHA